MAFGLLTSPACHAPGGPWASAQADDAGRLDRPEATATTVTNGAGHAR